MKFIINREEILLPLQQIVSVIEKRQTMPILSNVLMVIEEEQLTLTGTDLEIQIIAKINIAAITPGSITVPARKFLDICRLLPSGAEIKFELQEDKVKITSNRSRFSLSCLPADNYPEFAESELENHLFINAGKFKKALDKTVFCMANQDVRYYLNGLLVNVSNSKLKLVASDGHRLSIYEDDLDQATGFEARIILPRKGVLELSRLLDDPEAELKVEFSSNNIRVFIKNLIFSAKLVDSKYPDFGKVFQQEFFNKMLIQKQVLKDALTRVAILSNEKFKGVTFDITPDSLKISTHNPEHDEAEEELMIEYSGEPLTIAFNAQYLLDAVSNLDSEMAVLTIASNASSCFIDEPDECGYKFIVMPMRL
ncbi:MAG: DNA polymerase III subunit beta [Methylobacter sp.]|nr:DNA polymerase III subunit beta [Methylobacter sp.]MDP2427698.1 DNA polymerase III subunit beta [Methylobacter sp.]MDP3055102.1 DNA polymerase III subunit beta [Methylobacter sp.]MDP3360949.1 DNA polymerase III subunit beta [Methylobacter sp.]MDZ4221178.1 DNA polymerase III subunit beta [Methylobacter sp.]